MQKFTKKEIKRIKRAAIRYQNSQAKRGLYVPNIPTAIREVEKERKENE